MKYLRWLDDLPGAATECSDPFELPPEQRDVIIEYIAGRVAHHHFSEVAALAVEMMKPLSFLAAQGTVFAAPFLYPFAGEKKLNTLSAFLSDRDNLERLLQRLLAEGERGNDADAEQPPEPRPDQRDDGPDTGA